MIATNNVSVRFGQRTLYKDVNIKFTNGNCYGLIGANGAGKSTFLKVLSGELKADTGEVYMGAHETLFTLKQDHFAYDENSVMDTVIMGNEKLYAIMKEKDALYAKADFNDEDGERAGLLEAEFAEMDGWNAESDAAILLNGLGIDSELHDKLMKELTGSEKVKVLLAQALFGRPDTLLLDEPTNNLDLKAIAWLENFLINYEQTIIVVSHDRHFLNKVCTHIADVDYGSIKIYAGNYDFWYESSQLLAKQMKDANRKKEDKMKELEAFIARFAANASKSKQATSRKKTLDKIVLDELKPSTRRYPFIDFKAERESGKQILFVEDVCKCIDGEVLLHKVNINIMKGDKVALVGDPLKCTTLLKIINNELVADEGSVTFGQTISPSYVPNDNTRYFESDDDICTWLSRYTDIEDPAFIRGFLGRMLFSGEEALKKVNVLSGGEKARCMLSKAMLEAPNFLMLDDPTNHLDLEAITALNNGLIAYKGEMLFTSHDHQFIQTIANRIIMIKEDGTLIDRRCGYDDFLEKEMGITE
ncbi:MAG: ATP-binding cassette domain-containing protein [Erysipelotrichia bacterium]|nr:ATP-binding cassette domain-containing protein [Erysipelotrichia bacterium]NCC54545.1 ATP-binding cassette domain-containing protein [Erysipelotrichia bacterium]